MTAPFTVEDVKAKYPNPEKLADQKQGEYGHYCVGGAICNFALKTEFARFGFPEPETLHNFFQSVNPELDDGKHNIWISTKCAKLAYYNDQGNFKKAWAIADELLKYNGGAT